MSNVSDRLPEKNSAIWVGTVSGVVVRLSLNIAIARLAGADEMGIFVATSAMIFLVGRGTDAGLPNSLPYFARLEPSYARRCARICVGHSFTVLPLSAGLFWVATNTGVLNEDAAALTLDNFVVVTALSSLQMLSSLMSQLLVPLNSHRAFAVAMVIAPVVTLIGCVASPTNLSAARLLELSLVGELISVSFALYSIWRATPTNPKVSDLPSIRSVYSYGVKTYFGTSIKAFAQRTDRIILSWFIPNSDLAAYAIAISLRDNALLPINTHALILRNKLIDRYKSKNNDAATLQFFKKELLRWLAASAALAVLLGALAPVILPNLYGKEFQSSALVLAALAASLPAIAISTFCWTALLSKGKVSLVSVGLTTGGLLNVAALYFGAQWDGVMGACWGTLLISTSFTSWWLFFVFRRI